MSQSPKPSALLLVASGAIGCVVGAIVGFGIGLVAGLIIAEMTAMSCFEGACSYFAVLLALIGMVIGALACGILAVRLARRR